MNSPQPPKRGRPKQDLAARLAGKTTAADPTNFEDPEHWFSAVKTMHSFGRMTTVFRALFEAKIGRRLESNKIESLVSTCPAIRVVDSNVQHCCNPFHRSLVSSGIVAETPEETLAREQTLMVDLQVEFASLPAPSEEEELADVLDHLDGQGPARALNYEDCFRDLTNNGYSSETTKKALRQYGVQPTS